ncbi:hypothetical protein CEP53_001621 [Fusarium sp. AF-6]|nr:hypothetical protein CEP53_001621 [Fusarium sp. AF-6]
MVVRASSAFKNDATAAERWGGEGAGGGSVREEGSCGGFEGGRLRDRADKRQAGGKVEGENSQHGAQGSQEMTGEQSSSQKKDRTWVGAQTGSR